MDNKAVISVFAILIISYESEGKLIQVPHDTASKVNESTYFNCSTNLSATNVFWYHGARNVYTGREVYEDYKERVAIDINSVTGSCNLIIHSVQPDDAGEYKCWEDEGTKEHSSAMLVVLDDDPICQSNMKLNDVIGQNTCHLKRDEVQLSCSVTYHGVNPPRMEWKKREDYTNIAGKTSNTTLANTFKSTLMLENEIALHNSVFICQINGTADNQYTCVSEVIRLSYSVDGVEVLSASRGANLTCLANTTFTCQYRWFQGNDSLCPVSCNRSIIAYSLGEYHCEAKCPVRGKSCTFLAMKVYVHAEPEHAAGEIVGSPVMVFIAIGSCLFGATGVAIYLYLNPRKKPRNIDEALTFMHHASDLLLYPGEKDKKKYMEKTGQDYSKENFISEDILAALKQVHLMFERKDTSHKSKTGSTDRRSRLSTRVQSIKSDELAIEPLPSSVSDYCELTKEEKSDVNVYTSIESGTSDSPNEDGDGGETNRARIIIAVK